MKLTHSHTDPKPSEKHSKEKNLTQVSYKPNKVVFGLFSLLASAALLSGCGNQTLQALPTAKNFIVLDGPKGSPTTFNGLSNTITVAGLTTNAGVNNNFLRSSDGDFTPLDLGDPAAGMVNAVNSSAAAVGVSNNTAFVLRGDKLTALTPPGSSASIAFGINDNGAIVGQFVKGNKTPGFVLINGTYTPILPTPAAMVVNAQGINNNGLVIGFYSEDGTHQHGFTYDAQTFKITLLPDPSTTRTAADGLVLTQFLGLNDNGEAVGYYQTNNGSQFGFLYNLASNTYTFIDAPQAAPVKGVQITQITGVSNSGVVSGFYIDANGIQHGFIANP